MLPLLLLSFILTTAAPSRAGTATCAVDLEQGRFTWTLPGHEALAPVEIGSVATHLARLDSLLAAGESADDLRRHLGRSLFGPYLDLLAAVPHWEFVSERAEGMPGRLGLLPLLEIPDESGDPAFVRHQTSLGWPLPLREPAPRPQDRTGALLLSAPFAPGIDPVQDDPDTLRSALRRAVRTVRLVPRNETGADVLRRALEEARPALWWFRGDADQFGGLHPALGALPGVVVWTLPSRADTGPPLLTPATLASAGTGPTCVIVSTRAVPETALAPLARRLADGLARGLDCGTALREAQRERVASGVPLHVAGSLVLIGDPTTTASLRRAPWLRRVFR